MPSSGRPLLNFGSGGLFMPSKPLLELRKGKHLAIGKFAVNHNFLQQVPLILVGEYKHLAIGEENRHNSIVSSCPERRTNFHVTVTAFPLLHDHCDQH